MRKFDDLMIFVAVVDRQSFVAAARQLGLPPTTVSRKVQDLEARLGVQLLRRTTRRISVTETGIAVYKAAVRGFLAIDEAEALARRRHDRPTGVVRVAIPRAVSQLRLSRALPEFRVAYPDIRLELLITNAPVDLIEFGCDCAIRVGVPADASYVCRPLFHGGYKFVAAPAFLDRVGRPASPEEARALPIALLTDFGPLCAGEPKLPDSYSFVNGNARREIRFIPQIASNEPDVLMHFVEEEAGCAILFEALCRDGLARGALEEVLPDWAIAEDIKLSIAYMRKATSESKVRVFVEFLMTKLREIPRGRATEWK